MPLCKMGIELVLRVDGEEKRLKGYYHPAGCMHASQSHLDLEPPKGTWLWDVARPRGTSLRCRSDNECVTIIYAGLGLEAKLCIPNARLRCKNRVYVMVTRSGRLYVGPVALSRVEKKDST
ncbi:hypothetical protein PYJP_01360 [Pyrofollis japonicus]|nr:hypothetical protein PYJP_01360 [Pyrofollis japonicus]